MTTETTPNTAPSDKQRPTKRPEGGMNRGGPLTDQEIAEIVNAASRTPGLGRIMLSLVRNRNARVLVPETAIGGEMFTIVSELDRVSARGERQLARALTLDKLQDKNTLQERALGLIEPLAKLTAEMALRFDNPTNSILRHSLTKGLLKTMQADKQPRSKNNGEATATAEAAATE